jgi:hypothetical protein
VTAQPPITRSNGLIATTARRALGAAKLDSRVLREIRDDSRAISQALVVVLLAAVAGAIGLVADTGLSEFLLLLVAQVSFAIGGWIVFGAAADFVGTKLIPSARTGVSVGQVLRTVGYADAPGLLAAFAIIPAIGLFVAIVGLVWVIVAQVVALRTTFETTTSHAIAIALIAGVLTVVVLVAGILLLAAAGVSVF